MCGERDSWKVDLHLHSTASDGSEPPSRVIQLAKEKGIEIVSLTDHDTVCGVKEAVDAGRDLGIMVVPGIEVTADASFLGEGKRELHILGYYVDLESKSLAELIEFSRNSRIKRNEELLGRLEELGYDVSYEEMVRNHGSNFGKPNIARVLMEKGYFSDREKAMDFLSSLGVKRERMDYREITRLIDEAGGIAIIAHPVTLKISYSDLYCFLKKGKDEKLSGLEAYHHKHRAGDIIIFKEICRDLKLYYTGGSDFHGKNKPSVDIGFLDITTRDIYFPLFERVY